MVISTCNPQALTENGLATGLFLAGLVGGFTHCAGMCGPFVLAQGAERMSRLGGMALLPYHLGRMTTYVTLAVLFNGALNIMFAWAPVKTFVMGPMLLTAGLLFLLSAFPRLAVVFPWLAGVRSFSSFAWVARLGGGLMRKPGALSGYGLGVLLGFMPCGLVMSALLATSAMPDMGQAALAMTAFALGTMPALVLTAWGGQWARQRLPRFFHYVTPVLLAFNGFWLIAMAASFIL